MNFDWSLQFWTLPSQIWNAGNCSSNGKPSGEPDVVHQLTNITEIFKRFQNFPGKGKPSIKKCLNKEIVLIYLDPLPPSPNKEIKNKEIFVPFLTPSLLPKIRKSDIFLGVFKKQNFAFLNHKCLLLKIHGNFQKGC